MFSVILALFLGSASAVTNQPALSPAQLREHSKEFWIKQFAPFEETGFTQEMVDEAKQLFFSYDFLEKTDMGYEHERGIRLLLWTIIDGDMYVQQSPEVQNTKRLQKGKAQWKNHLKQVMQANIDTFPKKIQFWTRINSEHLQLQQFTVGMYEDERIRRLDLEFPHMYWDNHKEQNVIVQPGDKWLHNHEDYENDRNCVAQDIETWEHKKKKAFFAGTNTGINHDDRGRGKQALGRLKLMQLSLDNPDLLEVHFTKVHKLDEIEDLLPKHKHTTEKGKELCEHLHHKYLISIDGWSSDVWRLPMILKSSSVPIVVESEHTPLYFDAWVPWTHYVPVKKDLSDLIENLMWLHNYDKKAKKIAENGSALFDALYTPENMLTDAASVFIKYRELMKYEPERPDQEFFVQHVDMSERWVKDEF